MRWILAKMADTRFWPNSIQFYWTVHLINKRRHRWIYFGVLQWVTVSIFLYIIANISNYIIHIWIICDFAKASTKKIYVIVIIFFSSVWFVAWKRHTDTFEFVVYVQKYGQRSTQWENYAKYCTNQICKYADDDCSKSTMCEVGVLPTRYCAGYRNFTYVWRLQCYWCWEATEWEWKKRKSERARESAKETQRTTNAHHFKCFWIQNATQCFSLIPSSMFPTVWRDYIFVGLETRESSNRKGLLKI